MLTTHCTRPLGRISTIDKSQRTAARIAGLACLISFVTVVAVNFGIFARLIGGNAAETARNILTHETLFRIGVAGDMVYCFFEELLVNVLRTYGFDQYVLESVSDSILDDDLIPAVVGDGVVEQLRRSWV